MQASKAGKDALEECREVRRDMFMKMDAQQGRILAILLSAMTFLSHALVLVSVLRVNLSTYTSSDDFRTSPSFITYNVLATCASAVGILGAVKVSSHLEPL